MSDIKFSCSNCGQHITIDASYAGDQLACPNCQAPVTVPAAGAAPAKRGGWKIAVALGLVVVGGGAAAMVFLKGGDKETAPDQVASQTSGEPANPGAPDSTPPPARPEREPVAADDPAMGMMAMNAGMGMGMGSSASVPPAVNSANPWPQWRGPNRDGISPETGLLKEWPRGGPPLAWKATECGQGYSSVAVAGGRVFTMGDGPGGSAMHCFDENSGQKLWSSQTIGRTGGNYDGTKSTPTVDGDRVYGLGQFGDLICLEAGTGREVWRKSLTRDMGGQFSNWNYAESPLVDGDNLIVSPGGSRGLLAALHKATGAPVWRSAQWTDEVQYVSPVVSELGGRRHYITLTQQTLAGVDAANGQILWRAPRAGQTAVIPTPVIYNNIVFVTSGYGVGCNAFQVSGQGGRYGVKPLYANKELVNHHGGVVLLDKYVYGHSDRGGWKCMDVTNGEVKWAEMGVGKGAVVFADGHLYCRAEAGNGSVALVEATPAGYREKGRFNQPDRSRQNSWAHPVIANGRLYLRDQDVLLCYDVRAK
jgi:outer membrane protein assembly factor BamB